MPQVRRTRTMIAMLCCALAATLGCGGGSGDQVPDGSPGDSSVDSGHDAGAPATDGGHDAGSPDAAFDGGEQDPDGGGTDGGSQGSDGGNPDAASDGGTECGDGESRYEPGCGDAPPSGTQALPGAGCYVPCDGADDTRCPGGTECLQAWINPCVCPGDAGCCSACGGQQRLCLEP